MKPSFARVIVGCAGVNLFAGAAFLALIAWNSEEPAWVGASVAAGSAAICLWSQGRAIRLTGFLATAAALLGLIGQTTQALSAGLNPGVAAGIWLGWSMLWLANALVGQRMAGKLAGTAGRSSG